MNERDFNYFRGLDPSEQLQRLFGVVELKAPEFFSVLYFPGQEGEALNYLNSQLTGRYPDSSILNLNLGEALGREKQAHIGLYSFLDKLPDQEKEGVIFVILREIDPLGEEQLRNLIYSLDNFQRSDSAGETSLPYLIKKKKMFPLVMVSFDTFQKMWKMTTSSGNRWADKPAIYLTGL